MLVVADHGAVQVSEPVDLRGDEEADVDPSGLEPVREDLGHRDDRLGRLRQLAPRLTATAREISTRIGYRPGDWLPAIVQPWP
jgi:hypothetical protein